MTVRVAINGYGRIGRNILRALFEYQRHHEIELVAINDPSNIETLAHLTRYDSTHGPFQYEINHNNGHFIIDNKNIAIFSERDPTALPWKDLEIDVVYECSGVFTSGEKAKAHLDAGAKKVLISAPGKNVDATVVYGVNHHTLTSAHKIISNASCTTNCLAPLVKPLHEKIGVEHGLMTTIHAFTSDQCLLDSSHSDLRRARSATASMIPTNTGAAAAVGLVLPELNGKLDGFAMRVPTANVSVVDLTFTAKRSTTVEEINAILKSAAENELKNVLAYNDAPLVSIDFNHHPASSVFDASQTRVIDNCVKVLSWYDNEWGFSNRMLDMTLVL